MSWSHDDAARSAVVATSDPAGTHDLIEALRRQVENGSSTRSLFVFLRDGEGDVHQLTVGDLDARARAIAVRLQQIARPGDRALIVSAPGLEYISGLLGCLYAGVIAVPAYPSTFGGLDRDKSRLSNIIVQSQAAAVCLTSDLGALADGLVASGVIDASAFVNTDEVSLTLGDRWTKPDITPGSVALLQYTSGSTGSPKGVMLTHRNLLTNSIMIGRASHASENTKFVSWLPPYHDMGLIGFILTPLIWGAQSILMPPVTFLERPARWLEAMTRYRGEISAGPNFAYDLCVRRIQGEDLKRLDLASWRVGTNGAEPVRLETLERFSRTFSAVGLRSGVLRPAYGLAESTLLVSRGRFGDANSVRRLDPAAVEQGLVRPSGESTALTYVSAGRPMEEAAIVDPVTCERSGAGEIGEIWLRGASVAQGYWGREEETIETFRAQIAHSDDPGGWLRTGDLGFLDEGELFIVGRRKDMLIVAGRNIHPHDVEATAQKSHRAIRPGCGAAFAVQGQDGERIVLVQEVDPAAAQKYEQDICGAIRGAVAQQHGLRLDEVVLIAPRTLQKTTSGKIQRSATRTVFLRGELIPANAVEGG
jgi:acyl-CoA synthetase (AMP-forming)/AMP-acid ligase II